MPTTWSDLMQAAQQILRKCPEIRIPKTEGFIYYYFEPSFGDHFSLFLIWKDNVCHWERTIWEATKDSSKFGTLEYLRYLGQTMHPTFERSSGNSGKAAIQPLLSLLATQSLTIMPGPDDSFMVDGDKNTLTIGQFDFEVVYQWRTRPIEWAILDEVKNALFLINDQLSA